MNGALLDMQMRSVKLTMLVDDLRAIEAAIAVHTAVDDESALDIQDGRLAIELHRELLVAEGWRS